MDVNARPPETPAERIIRLCGVKTLARWTGLKVQAVYKWKYPKPRGRNGLVPDEYQQTILDQARLEGLYLDPTDFFRQDP